MSEQHFKRAMNGAAGELQATSAHAQAIIEEVADRVADGVGKAGDQASAAVGKFSDGAIDAYDRASQSARKVGHTVEPLVRRRPYAALAISAVFGLVVGRLMTARGPKVIYVRPPD